VAEVETRASQAIEKLEGQGTRVDGLISDAEKMVSGATVAGLAKAFSDEKAFLESRMRTTFWGFLVGIALLGLFSIGLAAYVLHIPITIYGYHLSDGPALGQAGYEITVAGVLSRAIVLIGPFWLTQFSARRYRSLFDLRQQYSHKYNMAFSMEGFKTQAPQYAENIAAWVFTIVAANPIQQRAGGPMDESPSMSLSDLASGAANAIGNIFKPAEPK
jgi:hypothetical protein